jgi:hypothetical protein
VVLAVGALGQLQFAQDDGAGCVELAHHCGILGGAEVLIDRHAGRGRHPLRRAQILDRDRHAVERPADLAAHDLGLGGAGLNQRRLGHHMGETLELAVQPFDACQFRRCRLDRRDFARVKTAGKFGQVKIVKA